MSFPGRGVPGVRGPPPHLGHQALVLTQPGLPHGCFAVETPCQLLQLLLTDQLVAQRQLPLMLRFLQLLPGLREGGTGQVAHPLYPTSPHPPVSYSVGDPQVEEHSLPWDGSVLSQYGFCMSWGGPELPQEMDSTCSRTHPSLPKDLN